MNCATDINGNGNEKTVNFIPRSSRRAFRKMLVQIVGYNNIDIVCVKFLKIVCIIIRQAIIITIKISIFLLFRIIIKSIYYFNIITNNVNFSYRY